MGRKRWTLGMLCAALLMTLCPFAAPAAKADDVPNVYYVGGLEVQPGNNVYKYYNYIDNPGGSPRLDPGTSESYNVALRSDAASDTIIFNDLSVTHVFQITKGTATEYYCVHASGTRPINMILLGDNRLTAPDNDAYAARSTAVGLKFGSNCSISGTGTLTAQGGAGTHLYVSYGICIVGELTLSSGRVTARSRASEYSHGILADYVTITGGKLEASGGAGTTSTGIISSYPISLTGSELILSGETQALEVLTGNKKIDFGSERWYLWKSNRTPQDPGGSYTNSAVTPYAYRSDDQYIHILPSLAVDKSELNFGTMPEGYSPLPAAQTVSVTNHSSAAVNVTVTPPSQPSYTLTPNLSSFTLAAGGSQSISLQPVAGLRAGEYTRALTFTAGACTSSVTARFTVSPTAPVITSSPANKAVNMGARAEFRVTATGTLPRTNVWQVSKDGGATWGNVPDSSGADNYITPLTTAAMNGWQYRCIVSNDIGSATSQAATLTVYTPPVITQDPADQTVAVPASAAFSVVAEGAAPLAYQWEVSTDGGTLWRAAPGTANQASYTTPASTAVMDGNQYRCTVSNTASPQGVQSQAATLTVRHAPAISGDRRKALNVGYNDTVSNAFTLTGQPVPTVTLSSGPAQITWNDANKRLNIAAGLGAGSYTVTLTASNGVAPDASLDFTLLVTDFAVTIVSPASGTIYTDTPVTLKAVSTSMTVTSYQWYWNTADTIMNATSITGATTDTLSLPTNPSGIRYYFCAANGTTSSNIVAIDAKEHLSFVGQPAFDVPDGTTGTAIAPIDVSVGAANGTTPYRFSFDGTPPDWLSITDSGVISGTRPAAARAATTATVKVTDSSSPAVSQTITVNVGAVSPAALTFTHSAAFDVPDGTARTAIVPINVSSGAAGGTPPYTFNFDGTPPDWLSITGAGVISGTRPAMARTATAATVKVTDSGNPAQSQTITISVGAVSNISVSFTSLSADGSDTESTTRLVLTFSAAIPGLSLTDVSLTGATGSRLEAQSTPGVYTLYLSDVTVTDGGMVKATVSKGGYTVSPTEQQTAVRVHASKNISITPSPTITQGNAPDNVTIHVGEAGKAPNRAEHFDSLEIGVPGGSFVPVPASAYGLRFGSLHLQLSQAYLNTLPAGEYTLRVNLAGVFADQSLTTRLSVVAPVAPVVPAAAPPQTGDGSAPLTWLLLALLAACGLLGCLRYRRRARRG